MSGAALPLASVPEQLNSENTLNTPPTSEDESSFLLIRQGGVRRLLNGPGPSSKRKAHNVSTVCVLQP